MKQKRVRIAESYRILVIVEESGVIYNALKGDNYQAVMFVIQGYIGCSTGNA
jgi:hypothetical protein